MYVSAHRFVGIMFGAKKEFYLVLFQSENCNYNLNLVYIHQIQERVVCA